MLGERSRSCDVVRMLNPLSARAALHDRVLGSWFFFLQAQTRAAPMMSGKALLWFKHKKKEKKNPTSYHSLKYTVYYTINVVKKYTDFGFEADNVSPADTSC